VSSSFQLFCWDFIYSNISVDAFDSGSTTLDCPILQPSTPDIASPGSIGSDETNFRITSSLRSSVFDSPELGAATAVQIRKVSGAELTTVLGKAGRLHFDESGSTLKDTEPRYTTRRLPTSGQISAFRNSNRASRQLPKSKLSSRQGVLNSWPHESLKRVQQLRVSIKQDVEEVDDIFRVVSGGCSDTGSPERFNSLTRRSKYYDLGPKIRFAEDAHQVIMGDQSA
jgi:hypothetical protein